MRSLREHLQKHRASVTRAEGQQTLLHRQLEEAGNRRARAELDVEQLAQALTTLVELEQAWRRSFEQQMVGQISQGLSAVFADDVRLKVETRTVREVTSMELHLVERGVEIEDIVEGTGGSMVSILDMMLNLRFLMSVRPALERLMVLDEPFRMVEARHLPALGQLLRELADQAGVQFIIASHEPELVDAADVVYEVQDDGTVKQIKSQQEERL